MNSQLNPNAATFIPVSPTKLLMMDDAIISASPGVTFEETPVNLEYSSGPKHGDYFMRDNFSTFHNKIPSVCSISDFPRNSQEHMEHISIDALLGIQNITQEDITGELGIAITNILTDNESESKTVSENNTTPTVGFVESNMSDNSMLSGTTTSLKVEVSCFTITEENSHTNSQANNELRAQDLAKDKEICSDMILPKDEPLKTLTSQRKKSKSSRNKNKKKSKKVESNVVKNNEGFITELNVDKNNEGLITKLNVDGNNEGLITKLNVDGNNEALITKLNVDGNNEALITKLNVDGNNDGFITKLNVDGNNDRFITELNVVEKNEGFITELNVDDNNEGFTTELNVVDNNEGFTTELNVVDNNEGFITEHRRSPPIDLTFKPIHTFSDNNPFGALQTPTTTTPMDQCYNLAELYKSPQETPKKDEVVCKTEINQLDIMTNTPLSFILKRSPVDDSAIPFEELECPNKPPPFMHPPNANRIVSATELPRSTEIEDRIELLLSKGLEHLEVKIDADNKADLIEMKQNLNIDVVNVEKQETSLIFENTQDLDKTVQYFRPDYTLSQPMKECEKTSKLDIDLQSADKTFLQDAIGICDTLKPKEEELMIPALIDVKTSFTSENTKVNKVLPNIDLDTTKQFFRPEYTISQQKKECEQTSKLDIDLKPANKTLLQDAIDICDTLNPKAEEKVVPAFIDIKTDEPCGFDIFSSFSSETDKADIVTDHKTIVKGVMLDIFVEDSNLEMQETSFTNENTHVNKELMDSNSKKELIEPKSKTMQYEKNHDQTSKIGNDFIIIVETQKPETNDISSTTVLKKVDQVQNKYDNIYSNIKEETKEMRLELETHIPSSQTTPEELRNLVQGFEVIDKDELLQENYSSTEPEKSADISESCLQIDGKKEEVDNVDLFLNESLFSILKTDDVFTANESISIAQNDSVQDDLTLNNDFLNSVDKFSEADNVKLYASEYFHFAEEPQKTMSDCSSVEKEKKNKPVLEDIISEVTNALQNPTSVAENKQSVEKDVFPSLVETKLPLKTEDVQSDLAQIKTVTETLIISTEEVNRVPLIELTEVPLIAGQIPTTLIPPELKSMKLDDLSEIDISMTATGAEADSRDKTAGVKMEEELKKPVDGVANRSSDILTKQPAKSDSPTSAARRVAAKTSTSVTKPASGVKTTSSSATTGKTTTVKPTASNTASTKLAASAKPITSTLATSKPNVSGLGASKPVASSTAPSKPVASSTAPSKPAPSSTAPPKPVASSTAPSKPAASSTVASKPASSTVPSKPAASSVVPSKSTTSSVAPSKSTTSSVGPSKTVASGLAPPKSSISSAVLSKTSASTTTSSKPSTNSVNPSKPVTSSVAPSKLGAASKPAASSSTAVKPGVSSTNLVRPAASSSTAAKPTATTTPVKKPAATSTVKPTGTKTLTPSTKPVTSTTSSKPVPKQLLISETTDVSKSSSKPSTPTSNPTTPTTPKSPIAKSSTVKSPPKPDAKSPLPAKSFTSPKSSPDKSSDKKPASNNDVKLTIKKAEAPKGSTTATIKPSAPTKPSTSGAKTVSSATKSQTPTPSKTTVAKPAAATPTKQKPVGTSDEASNVSGSAGAKKSVTATLAKTAERSSKEPATGKVAVNGKPTQTKTSSNVKTDSKGNTKNGEKSIPSKKPDEGKKEEKSVQVQEHKVSTTNEITNNTNDHIVTEHVN